MNYNDSESQLHKAAQFLAQWAQNFVSPEADFSHTNLALENKYLISRSVHLGEKECFVRLNLIAFQLEIIFDGKVFERIKLNDRSVAEVENDLNRLATEFGKNQLDTLYYEQDNGFYEPETRLMKPTINFIELWNEHRKFAENILIEIEKETTKPSEARIWPHHFDTGTFYPISKSKSIGCGWAIADSLSAEPYFYAAVYAEDFDYSHLPSLGKGEWKLENWKGAILPLNKFGTKDEVINFFKTLIGFYLS